MEGLDERTAGGRGYVSEEEEEAAAYQGSGMQNILKKIPVSSIFPHSSRRGRKANQPRKRSHPPGTPPPPQGPPDYTPTSLQPRPQPHPGALNMAAISPLLLPDGLTNKKTARRTCDRSQQRKGGASSRTRSPAHRKETSEKILHLTIEIISVLAGEECSVVTRSGEPVTLDNCPLISGGPMMSSLTQEKRSEQKILDLTFRIIQLLSGEAPSDGGVVSSAGKGRKRGPYKSGESEREGSSTSRGVRLNRMDVLEEGVSVGGNVYGTNEDLTCKIGMITETGTYAQTAPYKAENAQTTPTSYKAENAQTMATPYKVENAQTTPTPYKVENAQTTPTPYKVENAQTTPTPYKVENAQTTPTPYKVENAQTTPILYKAQITPTPYKAENAQTTPTPYKAQTTPTPHKTQTSTTLYKTQTTPTLYKAQNTQTTPYKGQTTATPYKCQTTKEEPIGSDGAIPSDDPGFTGIRVKEESTSCEEVADSTPFLSIKIKEESVSDEEADEEEAYSSLPNKKISYSSSYHPEDPDSGDGSAMFAPAGFEQYAPAQAEPPSLLFPGSGGPVDFLGFDDGSNLDTDVSALIKHAHTKFTFAPIEGESGSEEDEPLPDHELQPPKDNCAQKSDEAPAGSCEEGPSEEVTSTKKDRGVKTYTCSECSECFTRRSDFANHRRDHRRERLTCPECGKVFANKPALLNHLTGHTGEKPYSCPVCGKCFTRNSNLIVHQATHLERSPFTALNLSGDVMVKQIL